MATSTIQEVLEARLERLERRISNLEWALELTVVAARKGRHELTIWPKMSGLVEKDAGDA
jgi:hypothetical protein